MRIILQATQSDTRQPFARASGFCLNSRRIEYTNSKVLQFLRLGAGKQRKAPDRGHYKGGKESVPLKEA
jgi:hypothetical protein